MNCLLLGQLPALSTANNGLHPPPIGRRLLSAFRSKAAVLTAPGRARPRHPPHLFTEQTQAGARLPSFVLHWRIPERGTSQAYCVYYIKSVGIYKCVKSNIKYVT